MRVINRAAVLAVTAGSFVPMIANAQSLAEAAAPEMMEFDAPPDLPGHEQGPRERPTPTPEAAPTPEPEAPRQWWGHSKWWTWDAATGDWAGIRTKLDDRGLSIGSSYTMDWSSVLSGGLSHEASTRHLYDINATLDFEKAFDLKGGSLFVDFYAFSMDGGSRDAGDWQGMSNIETGRNGGQLAEVWYQQILADGRVRLKAGKIDANSEFAFVPVAGNFLNASAAMSPTIAGMTTYPNPAFGALAFVYPTEKSYIGGAVFDGATMDGWETGNRGPDTIFQDDLSASWFFIGEGGIGWDARLGAGRAAVGLHHHTAQMARYDGGFDDGATGVYILGEQQVWRRAGGEEDTDKGLYLFAQAGWCDAGDVDCHFAGGIVLQGTFSGRDDDSVGIYATFIDLTDEASSPYGEDECTLELCYRCMLTPSVALTPDMQYIFNPSGDSSVDDAWVIQLRFEVTF